MPSVTSKDCKQAYSSEEQADEFVNDYLLHNAKKGRRNSTLFLARCAYRDAGESIEDARETLGARAEVDGLRRDEIERTIQSAYRRSGQAKSHRLRHAERAKDRPRGLVGCQ